MKQFFPCCNKLTRTTNFVPVCCVLSQRPIESWKKETPLKTSMNKNMLTIVFHFGDLISWDETKMNSPGKNVFKFLLAWGQLEIHHNLSIVHHGWAFLRLLPKWIICPRGNRMIFFFFSLKVILNTRHIFGLTFSPLFVFKYKNLKKDDQ